MMQFDSWQAFISMGGHGGFVLTAYAIVIIIVVFNGISVISQKKKLKTQLKQELEQHAPS